MSWQTYQQQIAEFFRRVPNARVVEDAKVMGTSGTERKLDAQVFVPMAVSPTETIKVSVDIQIVVDAKQHDRAVDIGYVDQVNGQREDVGAHVAVIASECGFTEGARNRAKQLGVFLMVLPSDLLALLDKAEIPWGRGCSNALCPAYHGYINNWRQYSPKDTTRVGRCDYCNLIHVICPDCYSVFGVHEYEYGDGLKCPGCTRIYIVTENHRSGDPEVEVRNELEVLLLNSAHEKSSKRLTKNEVEKLIGRTKWQYYVPEHPTTNLIREGFMEWSEGKEYLLLTEHGLREVVSVILTAEEPSAQ